jgi:non-canonical purine NTP pyrophosphatase (RdgB/HAM1 family)
VKKITFVTGNKAKVREVERILNIPLNVLEADIDEIQDLDLGKIALDKLNKAFKLVKGPVIVDDVSFEVVAWDGFPGPLIKWMLKGKNDPSMILKMLSGTKNRSAKAYLAVGFHDGLNPHMFIGEVKGKIASEIRGDNGFGWDKVFIPDGYTQTFAEMDPKLKDSMSHRGRALKKLSDFLKSKYGI